MGKDDNCSTGDYITKELDRTKNDIAALYDLDRKKAADMAEIKADIKEIKADHKNMKQEIAEFKKELGDVKKDINDVKVAVNNISQDLKNITEHKWQSKDLAIVIVAVISLISSVSVALIQILG